MSDRGEMYGGRERGEREREREGNNCKYIIMHNYYYVVC